MTEIWKDIEGYEGYYQVSNIGNVRGLDRIILRKTGFYEKHKGRTMAIRYNKRLNMYETYLSKGGKRKALKIHRLVAKAFIPNDDKTNKTTVNHLDGDRANNSFDNLEWCSYSSNLQHAYDVLNRPVNSAKVGRRSCKSINKNNNKETRYASIAEASRKTYISETQIRRLIANECINLNYEFYYI